jgi:hypothetical protein
MQLRSIEIGSIGIEDSMEMLLIEDQHVVEAFSLYTSQETLTDGIRSRSMRGCFKLLDRACCCNTGKVRAELAIVSRSRYLGACPYGVASRSCCATEALVGECVTPYGAANYAYTRIGSHASNQSSGMS